MTVHLKPLRSHAPRRCRSLWPNAYIPSRLLTLQGGKPTNFSFGRLRNRGGRKRRL